jgi:hypothetical protein
MVSYGGSQGSESPTILVRGAGSPTSEPFAPIFTANKVWPLTKNSSFVVRDQRRRARRGSAAED